MRQSDLFTKTRKEAPADEVARSAQLLIRAGYVAKEMAGVYSFLPLGLRVLNKIVAIIRREMNAIGGQEVQLSALQDPSIWQATNRWDDRQVDNWFKTTLKNGAPAGLGFTHEEALTRIMKDHISSYRDLPKFVYQFQTKFRNETRAKSGLLRTREFLMKDLYSFTATTEELDAFYDRCAVAYRKIFEAVGLGPQTFLTFASGSSFSKFSHEFQTLCPTGEDTVYLSRKQNLAVNKEVLSDEVLKELRLRREELEEAQAIEVGNIFKLGTRYAEALGLTFTDETGKSRPVVMGSYGIGPARVMATVVEVMAGDQGIVWPAALAPFDVHLVEINPHEKKTVAASVERLTTALHKHHLDFLHDDRDLSPGQKFADSDLLGLPWRIVISDKTVAAGKYELKDRRRGRTDHIAQDELLQRLIEKSKD